MKDIKQTKQALARAARPTTTPKKCLLAIGYPTAEPLTYRYETIGHFPTKTAAKEEIAGRRERQPDLLFLILETNEDPRAAVYQKFADALGN